MEYSNTQKDPSLTTWCVLKDRKASYSRIFILNFTNVQFEFRVKIFNSIENTALQIYICVMILILKYYDLT